MDLPPEKRACVCLACKGENGRSKVMFKELTISDSHETDEDVCKALSL